MLPPIAIRWLFRLSVAGFIAMVTVHLALTWLIAHPRSFFTHADGNGTITFHATHDIPPEARVLADMVTARLAAGPLGAPDTPVDIWLVDGGLPLRIFFAGSPTASGLTYPVASTRNVFLRHAEISIDRLVRDGVPVPAPRTLSYYLVHEITHLQVARAIGRWRIVRLPLWINEGYADYVALGPASAQMIAAVQEGLPLSRRHFGTYPRERTCVTLALAVLEHPDDLFALDAPLPEIGCPLVPELSLAARDLGA